MLLFSIAFFAMLSGYDAYVNACSSQGDNIDFCKCQADFLALKISDDNMLELAVAGANAMSGRGERLKELAKNQPDVVVAMQKLEKETVACDE